MGNSSGGLLANVRGYFLAVILRIVSPSRSSLFPKANKEKVQGVSQKATRSGPGEVSG